MCDAISGDLAIEIATEAQRATTHIDALGLACTRAALALRLASPRGFSPTKYLTLLLGSLIRRSGTLLAIGRATPLSLSRPSASSRDTSHAVEEQVGREVLVLVARHEGLG